MAIYITVTKVNRIDSPDPNNKVFYKNKQIQAVKILKHITIDSDDFTKVERILLLSVGAHTWLSTFTSSTGIQKHYYSNSQNQYICNLTCNKTFYFNISTENLLTELDNPEEVLTFTVEEMGKHFLKDEQLASVDHFTVNDLIEYLSSKSISVNFSKINHQLILGTLSLIKESPLNLGLCAISCFL